VDFLERLRRFLRHPVPGSDADIRYRQHFLALFERRESEGASSEWMRHTQEMLGSRLDLFVSTLSAELLAHGIPAQDIPTLVDTGIALALKIDESRPPPVRWMILQNAVALALDEVQLDWAKHGQVHSGWADVSRYAWEIQAVRHQGNIATITDIGRMLLTLAGRESIKWLLHVEVTLSTGALDPWRINRQTLQALSTLGSSQSLNPLTYSLAPGDALNFEGLQRMEAFGLLSRVDSLNYRVLPHAQPILHELGDGRDSPMSILVQALLEDDIRGLLPGKQPALSTTATVRQARMVMHEIGHTVTPIQVALNDIARTARPAGIADQIAEHLQRANQALDRLRSFSSKLDELAQLAREVSDVFDAKTALQEAVRLGQPETGHLPAISLPEVLPQLLGVRSRFVLALVTLLRNAYQAAPAESPLVAITAELEGTRLRIHVDDNGPGVSPAERERIFLDGYSTRAGGSGRGLALARAAIESDMNGSLTYEDGSSLGGARFAIVVPLYEERNS
jgi:signal transduction histidine kinase